MELNITRYFVDSENDPYVMCNSIANLGNNARKITWDNSLKASDNKLLTTEEMGNDAREWFSDFGAWTDEEIQGWSATELEARILQYAAGEINEIVDIYENDYVDDGDLELLDIIDLICGDSDYRDTLSGHIYVGDDNNLYIYVGS